MKVWNFRVFVSERGNRKFDEWLSGLPIGVVAKVRKIITYLEITETWHRPFAAKLKGTDKIWEIIVGFDNIQYRPLGCFGPKNGEFTLLIGAKEKGHRFEPINAVKIAEERRNLIFQHERYTDEYY